MSIFFYQILLEQHKHHWIPNHWSWKSRICSAKSTNWIGHNGGGKGKGWTRFGGGQPKKTNFSWIFLFFARLVSHLSMILCWWPKPHWRWLCEEMIHFFAKIFVMENFIIE